ncbi:MAG TPA: hypothetical protein VIS27_07080 [Yeosuana sp.]
MENLKKATLAEIRELAFTNPEFEKLLDLIPEGLSAETIFYDVDYLYEEHINTIVDPIIANVKALYPFLFLYDGEDVENQYIDYYFLSIDVSDIEEHLLEGSSLEFTESLYYLDPAKIVTVH